jgi:uncharacterized membrane protein YedE/YeeE
MQAIILGLITGVFFGWVLQKGRVCFNSAFRDLYLMKDNFLFKGITFSMALEMLIFPLMAASGLIKLNPKPFNLLAQIIGGLIFGMGMVLAGGCASGTTYRVGEGNTTSWMAALTYGFTAAAMKHGGLNWITKAFSKFTVKVVPSISTNLYHPGKIGPTLATALHINHWIIAVIFSAILLWYVFGTKTTKRPESKLGWKTIGILLTLVAMFGFWSSYISGRHYGLGITGGWINVTNSYTHGGLINWEGAEVLGIIIGAFISALLAKEFKFRVPKKGITYLQTGVGGAMLGFGAVLAMGCNIGNYFTGIPQLGIGSLVAGVCFILGNWFMAYLMYGRS